MKLNLNLAKEFVSVLGKSDLNAQSIDSNGQFIFGFKNADNDKTIVVDPGIIAGLIQLKKSVERGQSPEQALQKQIAAICNELKI